jgi:hypothetical protein
LSEAVNPRLKAALAYAQRGWHVFPCLAGLKVPATENGHLDATTDAARIAAWWEENPAYNVAIATGPSGLLVVDVDPAGVPHWDDLLAAFPDLAQAALAAPRVATPRQGWHVYFEGEGPSTVRKLAPGIDTRGAGGYVVAPPSVIDDGKSRGEYSGDTEWAPLVPLPEAFGAHVASLRQPVDRAAPALPAGEIEWDHREAIARAERWLDGLVEAGDVAIEGCGGDQRTYEVACRVLELGITPERAASLIADRWNPHCRPPWDEAGLRAKVRNAWTYGQETRGGKAEKPLEQEYAHLLETSVEEKKYRYEVLHISEARQKWAPPEWLIENVIPTEGTGVVFGPSGTFKSFALLDVALSLSTGHGPNWWQGDDREPRSVLYLVGEGPSAFVRQRTDAWYAAHGVPGLDRRSRLYTVKGVPPFEMHVHWQEIIEQIEARDLRPALIVIDTLSRAMAGLDENSAKDVMTATLKMEAMSRRFGSFVLGVHHTGKSIERGMRGSYAWFGNSDVVLETERKSESHVEIDMHVRKMKDGDRMEHPIHLEGELFGSTLAFRRVWGYEPPEVTAPPKALSGPGTEEWLQPAALYVVLSKGPLHIDHLAVALSQAYQVSERKVRRALLDAKDRRLRAWCPDGLIWQVPAASTPEGTEF